MHNLNVDWNEQAVAKAREYLNIMQYSRQDMINQLEFEGFTEAQAAYAADAFGLTGGSIWDFDIDWDFNLDFDFDLY